MEDLIRQAFLHIEVIGPHVAEGHYDLVGPNGDIILPQVWETVIEPDWTITMHMWPVPEKPKDDAGSKDGGADGKKKADPGTSAPLFALVLKMIMIDVFFRQEREGGPAKEVRPRDHRHVDDGWPQSHADHQSPQSGEKA
jgi:hypothetical protein